MFGLCSVVSVLVAVLDNTQQTTNNRQQTTNNEEQTTSNTQQTTNNKQQQTTNNKQHFLFHSAGPGLCPQRCVALRLTLRVALRVAVVGRNGSKMAPQLIMKRLYFEDAELCILDRLFAENKKSDGFTIVKP